MRRQLGTKLMTGAALLAMLPACTTHLQSWPEHAPEPQPAFGPNYRLPAKQFTVSVSWRVAKCLDSDEAEQAGGPKSEAGIQYKISADYTTEIVEAESFQVDYRKMVNRFKTGELSLEYWADETSKEPTRLLKSVNATIEGKEPEAVKSAIQTAANVAKIVLMGSGGIAGGGGAGVAKQATPCSAETEQKIKDLAAAEDRLEGIAADAKAIEDRFALLKSHAVFGKLGKVDRQEYAAIITAGAALLKEKDQLERKIAELRDALTFTQKHFVPWTRALTAPLIPASEGKPEIPETLPTEIKADTAKAEEWLTKLYKPGATKQVKDAAALLTASVSFKAADGEIAGKILTDAQFAALCPLKDDPEVATACGGIVYRQPIRTKVIVEALNSSDKPEQVLSKVELVPQFGRFHILPLRSRWGEKNSLSAEFSQLGIPGKVTYKALEAGGPKMVEALNQASTSALEIASAIRKQEDAKKSPEEKELADLKEQIDLIEARKKLAELSVAPDPAAVADTRELAVLQRQIQLAESRNKFAGLTAAPDEQVKSLTAELALLRMEAERAELQAAIRASSQP